MKDHKTVFISDLHLEENNPKSFEQFQRFASLMDETVDALYILGDLFEAWVGDDDNTPFHQKVLEIIRQIYNRQIPVYIMHGNRDFFIGKLFQKRTGAILLPDEAYVDLYGLPVLLMHGDTLCTRDKAYLKARKISRVKFLQWLFLMIPLQIRKRIGERMREKSAAHKQSISAEIMDVTEEEVLRVMQKHNVNTLIHGHTHRSKIHTFMRQNQVAERIVLDAWHDHSSMLVWHATGRKELITLP